MIDIRKVISRIYYKLGYEVRREVWQNGGQPTEMRSGYTPSGDYLGSPKTAHYLFKKRGIRYCEKTNPEHSVCSIGFNPKEQKWYGWSHRAMCGFKIGDRLFDSDYGNDKTLFIKHGKKIIKTLADAKLSASHFAEYVS